MTEGHCGFDDCPRCRTAITPESTLAERKRLYKDADWADSVEYTPEEQLINLRVAAARRRRR